MASEAVTEKNAIEDAAERVAIAHVIEKLEVDGRARGARIRVVSRERRGWACESYVPRRCAWRSRGSSGWKSQGEGVTWMVITSLLSEISRFEHG
jgi:hypothetical protein